MVLIGFKVWNIGWVGDDILSKLLQESNSFVGGVGTSSPCSTFFFSGSELPVWDYLVSHYLSTLILVPVAMKLTNIIPSSYARHSYCDLFEFLWLGWIWCCFSHDCCLVSGMKRNTQVSLLVTITSKKLRFSINSGENIRRESQSVAFVVVFCEHLQDHLVPTIQYYNFSIKIHWMVFQEISWTKMVCQYLQIVCSTLRQSHWKIIVSHFLLFVNFSTANCKLAISLADIFDIHTWLALDFCQLTMNFN